VRGAGFWPGAWLPPWLVQVDVTSAWAVSVTSTSPLPSPDSSPEAESDRPLSEKLGSALAPPLRCTLDADAAEAISASAAVAASTTASVRRIMGCSFVVAGPWRLAGLSDAAPPRHGSAGGLSDWTVIRRDRAGDRRHPPLGEGYERATARGSNTVRRPAERVAWALALWPVRSVRP
jgi:hypothetical protein